MQSFEGNLLKRRKKQVCGSIYFFKYCPDAIIQPSGRAERQAHEAENQAKQAEKLAKEAEKTAQLAQQRLKAVQSVKSLIMKPRGQAGRGDGRGYNLQEAMGVEPEHYHRLLVSTH